MAEEMFEEPIIYTHAAEFSPPALPNDFNIDTSREIHPIRKQSLETKYFSEVRNIVDKRVGEVIASHAETEENERELRLLFDVMFAPIRLRDPEVEELRHDREPFQRFKTVSARYQQALSHALVYSLSPNSNEQFRTNMHSIAQMYENISSISPDVKGWWQGVQGQVGGTAMLKQYGYDVYAPSCLVDPLELDDDGEYPDLSESEVYQWDVKKGIDVVAIKDGVGFCIDFKGVLHGNGRIFSSEPIRPYISEVNNLPYSLSRELQKRGVPDVIQKVSLIIPSRYADILGAFNRDNHLDELQPDVIRELETIVSSNSRQ